MKMKECKQKVKEFASKHKKKLIVAGAVGAGVVGGLVGWKMCTKVKKSGFPITDPVVAKVVYDGVTQNTKYGFIDNERTFTCEQLGEFGKMLLDEDHDVASKLKFNQILAFGNKDE